jgi:hypothetical protein
LFDVTSLSGASFMLVTALTMLGVVLSLGLPSLLVTHKLGDENYDVPKSSSPTATGQPIA